MKPAKVDAAMAWTCVWCAWEMPWDGGVINKSRSREPDCLVAGLKGLVLTLHVLGIAKFEANT